MQSGNAGLSKDGRAGSLKVHKNDNFFGFNFEFCTVPLLVILKYEGFVKMIFDWAISGGGRIIPRRLKTTGS